MSVTGPRSWVVAALCSVLNFLHLGIARLSGSLYPAVLETYHVDRSKASFPFVLCYSVRNISGPLVGYLATQFGIYTVTLLGGLIAFVGIGCCYFADDTFVILLSWGIVFGFGFGMGSVLIPEILNHHFDKYVSNANGIAFGGECIAGFVLPIFLKFSLSAYGTSGTFLILAGLMLNSIPAALMLKYLSKSQSPKVNQRAPKPGHLMNANGFNCSINLKNSDSLETKNDKSLETTKLLNDRKSISKYLETRETFVLIEDSSIRNRNEARREIVNATDSNTNKIIESKDIIKDVPPDLKQPIRIPTLKDFEVKNSDLSKVNKQYTPLKYYGSLNQNNQKFEKLSEEKNSTSDLLIVSNKESSGSHLKNFSVNVSSESVASSSSPFKIFLDPAFCMILLTQSTMLFNATMIWTIIVEFCRDNGLSSNEEIYILICFSVMDMIGRLGLGWVTDAGYMSNSTFSGMCCFGMGIAVATLVFFRKVTTIGFAMSIFGISLGGFLIVCPGMVNDHIDPDKRGMALASRFFLFAPMSLSQSPLIGYFRDKHGSYSFIFIIVAVLCMFSSVTSLMTPCAAKYKYRKSNYRSLEKNFDAVASIVDSVALPEQDGFTKLGNRLH